MPEIKLIFYEEFASDSAAQKKLRSRSSLHLPPGYFRFPKNDFNFCQSVPSAWPSEFPSFSSSDISLCVSVGHLFDPSQMMALKEDLQQFQQQATPGTWSLQKDFFKKNKTEEKIALRSSFFDLNARIEDFDFSILASRPRHFNQIFFEGDEVTKICHWKEKGLAEIAFFNSIPSELRDFFPQIKRSHENIRHVSYTMENKRRFDLGRLTIEGSLNDEAWPSFYQNLDSYFSRLPSRPASPDEMKSRLRELFIDKLTQRLDEFRQIHVSEELQQKFLHLTGHVFESRVELLREKLESAIEKTHSDKLLFSHGDLSFSNILYDIETKKISFVDPRGESPVDSSYRPLEYDLAKLSHSALGEYESICTEVPLASNTRHKMNEAFRKFIGKFSIPEASIRLYESSLFWSLLPLHLDAPAHLLQFMLAGERALVAAL